MWDEPEKAGVAILNELAEKNKVIDDGAKDDWEDSDEDEELKKKQEEERLKKVQEEIEAAKALRFSQTSEAKKSGKKKMREGEKLERREEFERMRDVKVSYEDKVAGLEKSKASDFLNAQALLGDIVL